MEKTPLQQMIELWEGIAELHRQAILSDEGDIRSKIKEKCQYDNARRVWNALSAYQAMMNFEG